MNIENRKKLLNYLLEMKKDNKINDELDKKKKESLDNFNRNDWLWHEFIVSISTWGNAKRAQKLLKNETLYNNIKYDNIKKLSYDEIKDIIKKTIKEAKIGVRNISPEKKADLLFKNFILLQDMGGCEIVSRFLLNIKGKKSKILFLSLFNGISEKYARNIFMDIYHEEFRNSIAVDERIKKILNFLEIPDNIQYEEKENILLAIAEESGFEPWELDRYIFSKINEIKNDILKKE